jgi:hypothetical protein
MAFSSADRQYEPLETIQVRYTVELPAGAAVRSVERSILWYTEGKGEEDIGVHYFERLTVRAAVAEAASGGSFESRLPASPLSYEGVIVKIRWCARVRLFFDDGRDFVSEHVFELGHVPVATMPSV